jgi:hypothetical protein
LIAITACVAASACHQTSEPWNTDGLLTILSDKTEYQRNQRVSVTIHNGTDQVLYDDQCAGEVQGFEMAGKWNSSYGDSRSCGEFSDGPPPGWTPPDWRSRSVAIQPGGVYVENFLINQSSYPGTWRVELWLRNDAGELLREDQRISNLFMVKLP